MNWVGSNDLVSSGNSSYWPKRQTFWGPSPDANSATSIGTSDEAALNNDLYMQAALQNQAFQTQSAEKAMKFSAEQAALDRKFQAEMSNTAYQRSVADLKAAGLNPILAYTNGPASTPGGSSAAGIAAAGAQANVDTYDWNSSKKNASANMTNAVGNIIGNSAKVLDAIFSIFPTPRFKVGF